MKMPPVIHNREWISKSSIWFCHQELCTSHLQPPLSTLDFTTFFSSPSKINEQLQTQSGNFYLYICWTFRSFFVFIWTNCDGHPNSSDVVGAWVFHQNYLNHLTLNRGLILTDRFGFLPGANYRHYLSAHQYYYVFFYIQNIRKFTNSTKRPWGFIARCCCWTWRR